VGIEAVLTAIVVGAMIVGLVQERLSPDVLVFGALVLLMLLGVVDQTTALRGFASPTVVTVAALFVLAGAMRRTGALHQISSVVMGSVHRERQALLRLTAVASVSSAFLNNTPIVAMFLPAVLAWCRQHRIAPSKLLIPLSYAAIVGGVCTLMGTSTNLLVSDLLRSRGFDGFGLFELGWVGVPCAGVALLFLASLAPRLLPERGATLEEAVEDPRHYFVEMVLTTDSPLVGRSIEDAGLRHLQGLFLVRIERKNSTVSPVGPEEVLMGGDLLSFAGALETIVDLQQFRGLVPAGQVQREGGGGWQLHEAVISPASPLVGTSIREAGFRGRYGAAVVAVHRHGEPLHTKLGDVVLRPGDTLLLEAPFGFARSFRDSSDFYLVSAVEGGVAPLYQRTWIASALLAGVVASAALGILPISLAALGGAMGAIALRCLSPGEARGVIDASVLVVIASSLGVATAIEQSGLASALADVLVGAGASLGTLGVLVAVYVATMVLTEVITNNAAAAMVFPVALAAASQLGADPRPFAIAVAVAASLSLATPLGYQTNLMVWGPGGYRFRDFLVIGLPLQLLLGGVAILSIWLVWG